LGDQKIRVYTFLEPAILTRLDELAASKGVSRSEAVRIAIDELITRAGSEGEGDITTAGQEITTLEGEVQHLQEMIKAKDSEILHLRGLTLDLRSLADNLACRMPALPPSQEEAKRKGWSWRFWRRS